jgi:ribosome-binding protein aMBF1 (putative translation factor)
VATPAAMEMELSGNEDDSPSVELDIAALEAEASSYIKAVGEQLQRARSKRGLNQADIARMLGRSRGWVGHMERGENKDHHSAKLYASALGIEMAVIVAMAEHQMGIDEKVRERFNLDS